MLFWALKQICISLVIIVLVHYIYLFFRDNLTVPKTKDLVNKPTRQYKEMYASLATVSEIPVEPEKPKSSEKVQENNNMKNELQNYLKELSTDSTEEEVRGIGSFGVDFASNNEPI